MTQHKLYGISNCDSVRAAKKWLNANGVDYDYIDFRKDGMGEVDLKEWVAQVGLDVLLNKRGTTWRKLDATQQSFSTDEQAIALLESEPTLIKRPVFTCNGKITVGFKDGCYTDL